MKSICQIFSKVKERRMFIMMNGIRRYEAITMFVAITVAAILSFSGVSFALDPGALPTGGKITSGKGSIATIGNQMTIKQSSKKMIADWETFNIGAQAGVTFRQRNSKSVALNRIYDQNPSQILGSLSANGRIYLINPAGIVFGEGSQVNVGGLIASSLDITDKDFLNNKNVFINNGDAGDIINQGNISAKSGGIVALIGPKVINEGTITATKGNVILAAGDEVTLNFKGNELISYTVDKGAIDALAENSGLIQADGGQVILTAKAADSMTQAVVNNTGVIEAQTLKKKAGRIMLMSDMENGTTIVDGTLDASAPKRGDGGFIETSAASVSVSDAAIITTAAPKGKSGTWLIDPKDFTIAASGGDMSGATLSTNLSSGNVTIYSSDGANGINGDIFVNDNITWSANTLTLNAERNIEINEELFGSGSARLYLYYGQGSTDGVIGGITSNYYVNAPINLAAGDGKFRTRLGSDGTTISYYVITNLGTARSNIGTDLQGMRGNLTRNYALGGNIDASPTSGWNRGAGFTPVGTSANNFNGRFEGLGHTITNLTINRGTTDYVGLFGYANGSTVQNIGLVGGSIAGRNYVGALVGYNRSTINNSHATGNVSGTNSVGGLIGHNYASSTINITNAYATGDVTGTGNYTGGLIGGNEFNGGSINVTDSYATGAVSGVNVTGGLIGHDAWDANGGRTHVTNSYATGTVSGETWTGGLYGRTYGSVTDSYATGNVTGSGEETGGLIGRASSYSNITNSYATGAVNGTRFTGGLAGRTYGSVTNAYATGTVSGSDYVGGLVGATDYNDVGTVSYGSITNSYATGNVIGSGSYIGGLVGQNGRIESGTNVAEITDAYATGSVTGGSGNVGGLVGSNAGTVTNSFWDITTTGQATSAGGTGLTTAEMMTQATFSNAGWDFTNNWWMSDANTRPFLRMEYRTNIINAHQLQLMAMNPTANYTLGKNIDMSELSNASGMWDTSKGFVPVGDSSTPFTGTFDGQNNIITNLTINRPTTHYVGLFGYLGSGSSVSNVGLEDGSVTGRKYVGQLAGFNWGTITKSYTGGSVAGSLEVGGLVGFNAGAITKSYATGPVSGINDVGGLAGGNYGSIANSYAWGAVTGASNAYYVSGLVGYIAGPGTVSYSYATGSVNGGIYDVGGLVGGSRGSATSSFWDTETTGQAVSAGGTGKTTAEMMNPTTFIDAGWDTTNIWNVSSYPTLK